MIAQNLIASTHESRPASENDSSQCSVNLLFKGILAKNSQIPVFRGLRNLQNKTQSTAQSIGTGKLISKKMRVKLINWLQKLALETFEFSVKTLLLAIKILDQYLCLTNESPSTLQLIGSACLYLAAKTSEVVIVAGQCYVVASANFFTEKQLFQKEMDIYKNLNYNTTFSDLSKVYKIMKQNHASSNLDNFARQEVESLFVEIAKNLELKEFKEHYIISMFIAIAQVRNKVSSSGQILSLLKKYAV